MAFKEEGISEIRKNININNNNNNANSDSESDSFYYAEFAHHYTSDHNYTLAKMNDRYTFPVRHLVFAKQGSEAGNIWNNKSLQAFNICCSK